MGRCRHHRQFFENMKISTKKGETPAFRMRLAVGPGGGGLRGPDHPLVVIMARATTLACVCSARDERVTAEYRQEWGVDARVHARGTRRQRSEGESSRGSSFDREAAAFAATRSMARQERGEEVARSRFPSTCRYAGASYGAESLPDSSAPATLRSARKRHWCRCRLDGNRILRCRRRKSRPR